MQLVVFILGVGFGFAILGSQKKPVPYEIRHISCGLRSRKIKKKLAKQTPGVQELELCCFQVWQGQGATPIDSEVGLELD